VDSQDGIIKLLQSLWPKNKAKGLLAQSVFQKDILSGSFGSDANERIFEGCWLLAPKASNFYRFRFCFFIHPNILDSASDQTNLGDLLKNRIRPFHAISEYMSNAGIGVLYAVPTARDGILPIGDLINKNFSAIEWKIFSFQNSSFIQIDTNRFFSKWAGNRGRLGNATGWDDETKDSFKHVNPDVLEGLLLHELFYAGLIKSVLKKPLNDPYDIDAFIMSISQKHIFPVEIKEKFPGINRSEKFFGIDAGRIMMLLRLCLPNESNAIYLIREMDESKKFVGWKYITLSDLVMTASWNLQAGGLGMGGQSTQTVILPYECFKTFDQSVIAEDNLRMKSSLSEDFKATAAGFLDELVSLYH